MIKGWRRLLRLPSAGSQRRTLPSAGSQRRNLKLVFLLGFLALSLTGCAVRSHLTVWATRPLIFGAMDALRAETDLQLAKTALEANLKLLDGLLEVDPENQELLILAAQGYTGYALMFVEDEDPTRAVVLYRRAKDYGLRALEQAEPAYAREDLNGRDFAALTENLTGRDIPAAYWTAAAWSAAINLDLTSPTSIAEMPRALSLMQWIYNRRPDFFYSAPRWFLGVYYASLPPMFGGDVQKAEHYFQEALDADGERFLLGKVMMAKSLAVQTLDREMYVRLLNEVLASPQGVPSELGLMNRIAQEKARAALGKTEEIFD